MRFHCLQPVRRQPSGSHGSRDEISCDISLDRAIGRHGDRARRREQRRHAHGEQGTEEEGSEDEQAQAFGQGEEGQEGEEARRQAIGLVRQLAPMVCSRVHLPPERSRASLTFSLRPRVLAAVQLCDRCLRFARRAHLDEAEPPRPPGVASGDDCHGLTGPDRENEDHLQRLSATTSGRAVQDGKGSNAAPTWLHG